MRARSLIITALILLIAPAAATADAVHVVEPGETLTSVAAADGLTLRSLAAANGLSVTSELIAGEEIEIPPLTPATSATQASQRTTATSSTSSAATTQTSTATTTSQTTASSSTGTVSSVQPSQVAATLPTALSRATPHPTLERVTAQEIAAVAEANNVPASLAEAVAWQESGWNNDELSAAGAVGVMQITPSTWRWIDQYLTPSDPLKGRSAVENIRAGVLLLHQLLLDTGSQRRTIEAYYQGLASVEQDGAYTSTKQYVRDVLAIENQLEA